MVFLPRYSLSNHEFSCMLVRYTHIQTHGQTDVFINITQTIWLSALNALFAAQFSMILNEIVQQTQTIRTICLKRSDEIYLIHCFV